MVWSTASMVISSPSWSNAIVPADRRFRSDVADDESVAAAGEAAIGNERNFFAEPTAHDRAGGPKHLPHPRTALGSFVTNHDDMRR